MSFLIHQVFHLFACIGLVGAAAWWMRNRPDGISSYRFLLPFVMMSSVSGAWILFQYGMELFVASYSGAIYEIEQPAPEMTGLLAGLATASVLPMVGLIPAVGKRATLMICIGILALVPGVVSLIRG